jgi:hypothetical protein
VLKVGGTSARGAGDRGGVGGQLVGGGGSWRRWYRRGALHSHMCETYDELYIQLYVSYLCLSILIDIRFH